MNATGYIRQSGPCYMSYRYAFAFDIHLGNAKTLKNALRLLKFAGIHIFDVYRMKSTRPITLQVLDGGKL